MKWLVELRKPVAISHRKNFAYLCRLGIHLGCTIIISSFTNSCCAVRWSIALGLLLAWHARLIHRGETSIEVHTNRAEIERSARRGVVCSIFYALLNCLYLIRHMYHMYCNTFIKIPVVSLYMMSSNELFFLEI